MGVILDTSILISIERGLLEIEHLIRDREKEPFGISAITASELLHGVHRADSEKRKIKREAFVERILDGFPVYPFDLSVSRIYARVWSGLARRGISVGAHDLMIACTALSLGFSVVTSDMRGYDRIDGLTVEKF
ncbi:tRNA(fMet)-specific endonuclease VapC [subsurface metagenome]